MIMRVINSVIFASLLGMFQTMYTTTIRMIHVTSVVKREVLLVTIFMTIIVSLYILIADEGLSLHYNPSLAIAIAIALLLTGLFYFKELKRK